METGNQRKSKASSFAAKRLALLWLLKHLRAMPLLGFQNPLRKCMAAPGQDPGSPSPPLHRYGLCYGMTRFRVEG